MSKYVCIHQVDKDEDPDVKQTIYQKYRECITEFLKYDNLPTLIKTNLILMDAQEASDEFLKYNQEVAIFNAKYKNIAEEEFDDEEIYAKCREIEGLYKLVLNKIATICK